jgi:hypothetical protein
MRAKIMKVLREAAHIRHEIFCDLTGATKESRDAHTKLVDDFYDAIATAVDGGGRDANRRSESKQEKR